MAESSCSFFIFFSFKVIKLKLTPYNYYAGGAFQIVAAHYRVVNLYEVLKV